MRLLGVLAKLGLSALLLWWIARAVDFHQFSRAMQRLHVGPVLLALLLFVAQALLMGWRWHRIVRLLGGKLPAGRAIHLVFIGLFFNQALPSSVGGDAVRVWYLHRDGSAQGVAFSSVAIERGTGLVLIGLLISVFTPGLWGDIQSPALRIALLVVGPCLLAGLALVALADKLVPDWIPARLAAPLGRLARGLRELLAHPLLGAEILALGAAGSLLGLLAAYVLGRGLGLSLGLPAYIVLVGGAVLFSVLPISLGGWGLREMGMVALFGTVGVAAESALVLSIIWGLLPLIVSLPGGVAWWIGGSKAGQAGFDAASTSLPAAGLQPSPIETNDTDR